MLDSVKISRRQSEIRQSLAELIGKASPTEDEVRSMEGLDAEYRTNETRFRAALVAEDTERREAGADLETRSERELADLMGRFELRQAALNLDEGRALTGATAEVVQELRSKGGYRGVPVPWAALETRAGETIASGVPDPIKTMPIIDRLFPASVAGRMGFQAIQIDSGAVEYPLVTSNVSAGWAATELGNVAGPTTFATGDVALKPDHTLGIQLRVSRKALKTAAGLDDAIGRDIQGAVAAEMDRAAFLGTGASGQPLGVVTGAATHGIAATAVDGPASWAAFRTAIVSFMTANAATGPGDVRLLIRPETWAALDGGLVEGTAISEFDRLVAGLSGSGGAARIDGFIAMSANALASPAGAPLAASALLTTTAGGVAPAYLGLWGALDLIRDPYSDAQSGGLRLTALATVDLAVARPAQARVLTGLE